MKKYRQLSAGLAAAVAVASLLSASAFADSRHANETRYDDDWRGEGRRERVEERRRGDDSRNDRDWDRRDTRRDDSYRHSSREPFYASGRISRVDRYRDGYRVWVGDTRYPFHVPSRHYHRDRFRVGVTIQLGGYYNPGGYYDYYDGYRHGRRSRADLYGTVRSVDYRRDAFIVRNERTGHHVTVLSRENIRRRELRPGDYVEVYGDWSRRGVFRAYDVDVVGY